MTKISGRGRIPDLIRIDGRVHILSRALRPGTPGRPASRTDYLDVEPFRGSTLWMSRSAAKNIIGIHGEWVDRVADLGLLDREIDEDAHHWFSMDLDWTKERLQQIFRAQTHVPRTYGEFELYNARRRILGIPTDEPYPDAILDAAVEFMVDLGVFSIPEARGLLILPKQPQAAYADLRRRKTGIWRRLARSKDEILPDEFRELLPEPVIQAPATCYDLEGEERPSPPPKILARLAKLGSLMPAASLYALRIAGRGLQLAFLEQVVRNFEILDSLITEADVDIADQTQVTRFLDGLAIDDTVGEGLSANHRDDLTSLWLSLVKQTDAVASSSPTGGADLRPFVPVSHVAPNQFRSRYKQRFQGAREYSVERKKRTAELSDKFDFIIAAARRRCDQLADVTDDVFAERSAVLDEPSGRIKIETLSWALSEDGTYDGAGLQTIHGWLWTGDALWKRLAGDGPRRANQAARRLYEAEATGENLGLGRFYYQYDRTTRHDGSDGITPWFATIFNAGAPISPSHLEVEHREQRATLIKRWRLPGFHPGASGLLSFDHEGSLLYRLAREEGIDLIALDEFDALIRASHLAFRAGAMTGCRLFETVQMAHKFDCWPVISVGPATGRTGWMAVPGKSTDQVVIGKKDFAKRFYMVDDETYIYFDDMAKVVVRLCHADTGSIPLIEPHANTAERCYPLPYVLSFNGRPISPGDLLTGLRYLLAGIQVCTFHDTRHSSANRGWTEGEDIETTMLRLGHAVERHSRYYRAGAAKGANVVSSDQLSRRSAAANMRYWETFCAS
ncbi:hypothetical protein SAQ01S_26040 [Sphingomonas aquatilis NBRC 16722]|nr:hypothetical protein SAQ01S_26040 [Sphingomonas aquatilis NBRC 16722]